MELSDYMGLMETYGENGLSDYFAIGDDKADTQTLKTVTNEINSALFRSLKTNCPILSGNMLAHIRKSSKGVVISGPSYDLKHWKWTGEIKPLTKEVATAREFKGKYYITRQRVRVFDYAYWVNKYGAFGTKHGNSLPSKGWVDRSIVNVVLWYGAKYGAEVYIDL